MARVFKAVFVLCALFCCLALCGRPSGPSALRLREPERVGDSEAALPAHLRLDGARVRLLGGVLDSAARKSPDAKISYVLVQGGEILLARDAFDGKLIPVGKASRPLLSLALGALESRGMIDASLPASAYSPLFRLSDAAAEASVSLKDLCSMRAGVPEKADALYEASRGPEAVFDAIRLADLSPRGRRVESGLSSSAAAYIAASRAYPEEKDLNAAYYALLDAFVFKPLDARGGLSAGAKFPPDRGVVTNMDGIAKWLVCETDFGRGRGAAQVVSRDVLDSRYDLAPGEAHSASFSKMSLAGADFYASGDSFAKVSHIVLINRRTRTAFAVFAANSDPKPCMELALEFARMLAEDVKSKGPRGG